MESPKKYIKIDGKLRLNPEFKAYMEAEEDAPAPPPPTVLENPNEASLSSDDEAEPAGPNSSQQTVVGQEIPVQGKHSTVSGGFENKAFGHMSTVSGGENNHAVAIKTTVGGGAHNRAEKERSTVSGGARNKAQGLDTTVGGGKQNVAAGDQSTISGGTGNNTNGKFSTIGGGARNVAMDRASTVSGGVGNEALGFFSTIVGGRDNKTGGKFATVLGGSQNEASGNFSIAMGRKVEAKHNRSCVINCVGGDTVASSKNQGEFRVHADKFVISVDDTEVIIGKKNITGFAKLLNHSESIMAKLEEQEQQIASLQKEIAELSR